MQLASIPVTGIKRHATEIIDQLRAEQLFDPWRFLLG
jgi:hypothetical protein